MILGHALTSNMSSFQGIRSEERGSTKPSMDPGFTTNMSSMYPFKRSLRTLPEVLSHGASPCVTRGNLNHPQVHPRTAGRAPAAVASRGDRRIPKCSRWHKRSKREALGQTGRASHRLSSSASPKMIRPWSTIELCEYKNHHRVIVFISMQWDNINVFVLV